jgi:hypothetical protein
MLAAAPPCEYPAPVQLDRDSALAERTSCADVLDDLLLVLCVPVGVASDDISERLSAASSPPQGLSAVGVA